MKNLAIIGASYLQLPLIRKAKEMGYKTHVFAWAVNDVGETEADVFYPISITEVDKIAEKCQKIGITGICSIASDLGNYTVNYVANKLGLPGNSMECTRMSTNKHLMREAFERNGDPSPRSIMVDGTTNLEALKLDYPIIVKPTDRSGSRGIYKLNGPEGLVLAVRESLAAGFEKKALIEEFAEGQEYSVEGISYNGEHHILAMTLKYTTGAPHFIETGHREPAPVSKELLEKVKETITHALDSLEVKNSASHSEVKIDTKGNIKIIEIGSRMGGDCIGSHLVYYSTGIDFVRAVIQVACGIKPELKPIREPTPVEVRYLFTKEDVEQMEKEKTGNMFIEQIAYNPDNIGHTTDSSNRAGCYIVKV